MIGVCAHLIQALTVLDQYNIIGIQAVNTDGNQMEIEVFEDIEHDDALKLNELGYRNYRRTWRETEDEAFGLVDGMIDTRAPVSGILAPGVQSTDKGR
jgi:hypothetical protein